MISTTKQMRPNGKGGNLRGQLANPGSPGKMAVKMEYVCVHGGDLTGTRGK